MWENVNINLNTVTKKLKKLDRVKTGIGVTYHLTKCKKIQYGKIDRCFFILTSFPYEWIVEGPNIVLDQSTNLFTIQVFRTSLTITRSEVNFKVKFEMD